MQAIKAIRVELYTLDCKAFMSKLKSFGLYRFGMMTEFSLLHELSLSIWAN